MRSETLGSSGHTASNSASAVARALADQAEDVTAALLGQPTARSRREHRWGSRGSLWVGMSGEKRGKWFDHEHGVGGDLLDLVAREHNVRLGEAIRIAERDLLGGAAVVAHERLRPPKTPTVDDKEEARKGWALRLWAEARPLKGTLGERYFLEQRKLDITRLDLDHCLRWHAGIGAAAALMTDPVTNNPIGVHRTFIDADGAKLEKKMLGRQGVVRLSPNTEVTMGLGITEGIEDGLAVLLSGWSPVWVATSSGAVARFPVLAGVGALTIFADADLVGREAATACSGRWRAQRRDVRVAAPGRWA